ncbi:MAG TPA: SIMPL domain-containing protein [Polyangiaceae bacterium]|jgi:hypothetical protein|nr:SIMPL domain-containing protein [Polyangiaceae bacterium]
MPSSFRLAFAPISVALGLATGCCHQPHGPHDFHGNVLSVTGTGDFEATPDIARITLGAEAASPTAAEATASTTTKIAAILAAVKQAGVADKDVQTSQLSIYSEQLTPPPPPAPQPAPIGPNRGSPVAPQTPPAPQFVYRATNSVTVTIRQIDHAGAVIGAAFAAGANQAGGIQFDVENHQPPEDQARAKAMADAAHRASELARLANVKLGHVVSIAESGAETPGPQPFFAGKVMSARSEGAVTPVESGQIKVTYTVQVAYTLDRD